MHSITLSINEFGVGLVDATRAQCDATMVAQKNVHQRTGFTPSAAVDDKTRRQFKRHRVSRLDQ